MQKAYIIMQKAHYSCESQCRFHKQLLLMEPAKECTLIEDYIMMWTSLIQGSSKDHAYHQPLYVTEIECSFCKKTLVKKKTHLNLTRSLNNLPERERDGPWHKKDSRRAWNIGNDSQRLGIYSTKLQRSLLGSGKSLYFPQKSNRTRKTLTSFPIGTLLPNAVRSPILKVGEKMFQKIWHVVFPSRSYKSNILSNHSL